MKLLLNAATKYFIGIILIATVIFLPAGTIYYWNGWLFIGLLFIPMLFLGIVLFWKAPQLLEKRLSTKEKETTQKKVVGFSALIFLGAFILAGFDYRFGWSEIPVAVIIIASIILLIGYGMYAEVMRENAYLSRTVEVQENQKVIDTGLYGVIRHPMYTATILLFLAIPIVLGSIWAFLIMLVYPILIIMRIGNEEKVLEEGLDGYMEYKQRVRYRLLPFIW